MNEQLDLFGNPMPTPPKQVDLQTKVKRAIRLLKSAERAANKKGQPVEVCYSGGKDSDVILELARMSGINFRAIYKNTTIDPPGTIKHCIEQGVEVHKPKQTFYQVIENRGYPTRLRRFCCEVLKEYKILDVAVQGIRRSESIKRSQMYGEPQICRIYNGNKKNHVSVFLPILEWTDKDVEQFIKERGIKCHPLYYNEHGKFCVSCRLGCMGCPQKHDNGLHEFRERPVLVKAWLRAGEKWWNTHPIVKVKKKYHDHYELFVRDVFCNSHEEFVRKFGPNLFHGAIDCKAFLSEYFGIKL
jgi:phosphoadenosine phosphosulfate reductase